MRRTLVAILGVLLAATAAAAQQTFPYTAYVTTDDVYIRSGPGENYYPTDRLKVGQEVEVYRHDPGGWYAIRPPKYSFSWVSSRYLQMGKNNLATVTEDRVAARVGSRSSDVRDVIQVRLHKGEVVEVLDAGPNGSSGASANPWCKIAPPSGEFRWVSAKFVDPDFPRNGVRRNSAAAGASRGPAGVSPVPLAYRVSAEQFQSALNDIDVELSGMVVESPAVWNFADLRWRTESLFSQAETAAERGRTQMVLSKIARFEDIKQKYNTLGPAQTDPPAGSSGQSLLPKTAADGRFDAVGQLTRVPDAKPGAPQYAILDANGKIRCYVSPAPGVNLRSYLGRQVGITGIRGYMPQQRATHLMARHVSVVEGTTGGTDATVLR